MTKNKIRSIIERECRKLVQEDQSINHVGFPLRLYGRLTQAKPKIAQPLQRHHPEHADPYQAAKLYTPDDVIKELDRRGGHFS